MDIIPRGGDYWCLFSRISLYFTTYRVNIIHMITASTAPKALATPSYISADLPVLIMPCNISIPAPNPATPRHTNTGRIWGSAGSVTTPNTKYAITWIYLSTLLMLKLGRAGVRDFTKIIVAKAIANPVNDRCKSCPNFVYSIKLSPTKASFNNTR